MTLYLPPSEDVSKIFVAFERFFSQSTIMPGLVLVEPQIKEKQRGHPPDYIVLKDPSLNRVKDDCAFMCKIHV